jgi:hypothetical protein
MPGDIPESLREIVGKALQKNREDRFASAQEMRDALEKVQWRKAETKTIDDIDFAGRREFDAFIAWCRELALNPKDIKNALRGLPGVTSFEDFKKLFDELRFAPSNQETGKRHLDEGIINRLPEEQAGENLESEYARARSYAAAKIKSPRRLTVPLGIGAVAILGTIIGLATLTQTSRTAFQSDDLSNQTANVSRIDAEDTNKNSNINLSASPVVARTAEPTPKIVPSRNNSTTPKPTATTAPSNTNSSTIESPTPTPKPAAPPNSTQAPIKTPPKTLPRTPKPTPKVTRKPVNLDCHMFGICP